MREVHTKLSAVAALVANLAVPAIAQNNPEGDVRDASGSSAVASHSTCIDPTFGATLFANYFYSVRGTEGRLFNRFDLDRVYLTMKTPLGEGWRFQSTTDIYRNSGSSSYYNGFAMRLKCAMVEYSPAASVSLKFGMIPGPWNGLVESYWRYRGVAQTASDRFGLINTADLGVSATYVLPGEWGDVSGYILNGPGYAAPEANRFKDFTLRATVMPLGFVDELEGLTLGGLLYRGNNGTTVALAKNRFGAFVGYSYSVATIGAEYLVVKNAPSSPDTVISGNLLSVFGELKMPLADLQSNLSFIARIDVNEPNIHKGGDITRLLIFGVVWKANERVWWSFDHQRCWTEAATQKATDGSFVETDVRWYLHAIINI